MICISDFRHRAVNILLFIVLFISVSIYSFLLNKNLHLLLSNAAINLFILFVLIAVLAVYLKTSKNINLENAIGKGDVAFFICVITLFTPIGLLVFLISSFIFTLALHIGLSAFTNLNQQHNNVPLAGCQAICLAVVISLSHSSILNI
jgi:membrane protease YdiL (CAAX protease family)